MSDTKATGA